MRRSRKHQAPRPGFSARFAAYRRLRRLRRPKDHRAWSWRGKLRVPWRRKKARPLGHAGRSRLKSLLQLARPLFRYFRKAPAIPAAVVAPSRIAEAAAGFQPIAFTTFLVRLAENEDEVARAQELRYRIFYEERGAAATAEMRAARRDVDPFDRFCDHLLVIDRDKSGNGGPAVVGTYRLLRRSVAERHGGFYSEQEFDLSALRQLPGEIVELGRSCVDPAYRSRGIMQMLWRGLAAYVQAYDIHLMFGCASFPGTTPETIGLELSYLHHYHLAPRPLRPRALPRQCVSMDMIPRAGIDVQKAISELPPLIKGYLRVGGFVGEGAVVDRQFNTTDVCVIVKTDRLTAKYERHYRRPEPAAAPR